MIRSAKLLSIGFAALVAAMPIISAQAYNVLGDVPAVQNKSLSSGPTINSDKATRSYRGHTTPFLDRCMKASDNDLTAANQRAKSDLTTGQKQVGCDDDDLTPMVSVPTSKFPRV